MMLKNLVLPTEIEVGDVHSMAMMPILEATLAMTIALIHDDYSNFKDVSKYWAKGELPPRTISLAQTICNRANELIKIIDLYRNAVGLDLEKEMHRGEFPEYYPEQ